MVLEASDRPLLVSNVDLSDAHVGGSTRPGVSGFLREFSRRRGPDAARSAAARRDAQHVLEAIFKALGGGARRRRRRRERSDDGGEGRRADRGARRRSRVRPYSQAIRAATGSSSSPGSCSLEPEHAEIVGDSIEEQTEKVFDNLTGDPRGQRGSGLDRIVKTTVFLPTSATSAG